LKLFAQGLGQAPGHGQRGGLFQIGNARDIDRDQLNGGR
jgi:hypothetical protein